MADSSGVNVPSHDLAAMTPALLGSLWEALSLPVRRRNVACLELIDRIVADGWAPRYIVEDLLLAMDPRLDALATYHLDAFLRVFDLSWVTVFPNPGLKIRTVSGSDSMSAADVVALLDGFERLGFAVDAAGLARLLAPGLTSRSHLTNAELTALWYERQRHKAPPLTVSVDGSRWDFGRPKVLKTPAGYRCELFADADGKPCHLTIRPSKYRARPRPVDVTCSVCDVSWRKGDPESSANHRREHKKRLAYLSPKPSPKMVAEIALGGPDIEHVGPTSPAWKHKEMHLRAIAFRREMRFDFVQWQGPRAKPVPFMQGILFTEADGTIVGACAFCWREYKDATARWSLDWVWVAPSRRRQGVLKQRWADLRRRFGDFHISSPVSLAMESFAIALGDRSLLGYDPEKRGSQAVI